MVLTLRSDGRMEFCKSIKIGPVRVYVTTFRMKKRRPSEERWRNKSRFRHEAQVRLWKRQKGVCAICGRQLLLDGDAEIHHVIPMSERPDLVRSLGNMQLLCHDCHVRVHREYEARNDL